MLFNVLFFFGWIVFFANDISVFKGMKDFKNSPFYSMNEFSK